MSTPMRLSAKQKEMLARLAAESGRPWEEVLDQALASLEQPMTNGVNGAARETVQAAMVRLGLLGCIADAPPDLSTNPQYFEGFGSRA
jgi:hypothetical protein